MIEPTKIYASSLSTTLQSGVQELSSVNTVQGLVEALVRYSIPLAVFSVFILLAFAGYQLMMSKGDPDKLKESREIITNAIVGFLFVILAVAILLLISNILNINISGN